MNRINPINGSRLISRAVCTRLGFKTVRGECALGEDSEEVAARKHD
jgi:hypothetical protein